MRIKLVRGRGFSESDGSGGVHVAVINESFASREFPGEDPIGRRIEIRGRIPGKTDPGQQVFWDIVGVIAGEKITGLGAPISAGIYVSYLQNPTDAASLLVRTDVPPLTVQRSVESAVQSVNKRQALNRVRTLEQIVTESIAGNRVTTTILIAFGGLASLLAAIGIYGVMGYMAARRAHEMGVRAALGATTGNLRRLIIGAGMRLTILGLLTGCAATVVASDAVSSMLYGVDRYDPLTVVVVAVVLALVATLACCVPAWRMTAADPMEALRAD